MSDRSTERPRKASESSAEAAFSLKADSDNLPGLLSVLELPGSLPGSLSGQQKLLLAFENSAEATCLLISHESPMRPIFRLLPQQALMTFWFKADQMESLVLSKTFSKVFNCLSKKCSVQHRPQPCLIFSRCMATDWMIQLPDHSIILPCCCSFITTHFKNTASALI